MLRSSCTYYLGRPKSHKGYDIDYYLFQHDGSFRKTCNSLSIRLEYLPIYPSNPHPDNDKLLYLEGIAALPKKSYVHTKKQHTIDPHILKPDRNIRSKLSKESLAALIEYINFSPPAVPPLPVPSESPVTRAPRRSKTSYSYTPAQLSVPVENPNALASQARPRTEARVERVPAPLRSTTVTPAPSTRPTAYQPYGTSGTYGTISNQSANTYVRPKPPAPASYSLARAHSNRSPTYYSPNLVLPISNYDAIVQDNGDTPSCLAAICGGLISLCILVGVAFGLVYGVSAAIPYLMYGASAAIAYLKYGASAAIAYLKGLFSFAMARSLGW